jgi:hypothetical protein
MAIITKPVGGIFKGVPATITLNKSELSALASVSADSYFSVTTNWNKVILSYKSFDGNQQEIVEFNATLSSPTGFFDVSLTARNFFEIQVIKIIDFDGGIFIVPRSELVIADFDVIFVSPPSSLSYTTPVIYTQNETITNNVPSVIGTVNSYSISPALPTGLTIDPTTGVISGTPTVAVAAANYTVTASNSGGPTTATINITVESAEVPITGDYITYNLDGYTTPATKNAFGGVSGGVYTANTDVAVKSSVDAASGDFDYQWKFNWSSATSINDMFVGVTGNDIVNGTSFYPNLTCIYGSSNNPDTATLWHNRQSGITNLTLLNGDNYYRLIRTGSTITHFFNGVEVYSAFSTPFTAYPTVRTMGNEACKESYISAVDEINAFNSAYISLPEPGKIVRLQPSINSSRDARFWFSEPLTGDFTFTATVKAGNVGESVVQALFGLNDITPPAASGYGVKQAGWGFSFDASGNLNIWDTTTIQTWTKGSSYNIEIKRVSGVISFKVGSTTSTYTLNNTSTLYIAGTLQIGSWEVTNASLVLPEVPVGDPILWQSKPGYIIEADGGATATSERPSYGEYYRVFAPSSQWVTGDFTFEAEINNTWQGNDYIGFYDSDTNFTLTTGFNGSQVRYEQTTPASYVKPAGDTYTVKMQRIGYVLKFYVNDVEVYSVTQTNLSTVKVPFFTFTDSAKHIVSAKIILPEAPELNYFLYNQVAPVHTTNQFGAISSTGIGSSYNTTPLTGNFDITFNFDAAVTGQDSIFGVKQTLVDTTDNYYGFRLYNNSFHTYFNGGVRDTITQNLGANAYRITRTGSTIDFYANGVKLAQSASYSEPLYLVARGYNTFNLISTVDSLGTGSNFVPVTWNVAGKTGVGTVTTGANGLITKSGGGSAYNVNVLSNETITGDGYVEFIYSSIFLNVVFGLAEINSPSGFYENTIYGTYVSAFFTYEIVTNGTLTGNTSAPAANGDVIRLQRIGTTFSILKNGSVINTGTINNTNPLKASICIYAENYGVNNVTISE